MVTLELGHFVENTFVNKIVNSLTHQSVLCTFAFLSITFTHPQPSLVMTQIFYAVIYTKNQWLGQTVGGTSGMGDQCFATLLLTDH